MVDGRGSMVPTSMTLSLLCQNSLHEGFISTSCVCVCTCVRVQNCLHEEFYCMCTCAHVCESRIPYMRNLSLLHVYVCARVCKSRIPYMRNLFLLCVCVCVYARVHVCIWNSLHEGLILTLCMSPGFLIWRGLSLLKFAKNSLQQKKSLHVIY